MRWHLLDDIDRAWLARELAVASGAWPCLAGLAAAVLDCAKDESLAYEIRAGCADLAVVGAALEAAYERARADDAAVRTTLLRLLASWQSFAARNR